MSEEAVGMNDGPGIGAVVATLYLVAVGFVFACCIVAVLEHL